MALRYKGTNIHLHGYVDSDFATVIDSQRSTIGYVFTLVVSSKLGVEAVEDSYLIYDRD